MGMDEITYTGFEENSIAGTPGSNLDTVANAANWN
jgi:hypothetical protein